MYNVDGPLIDDVAQAEFSEIKMDYFAYSFFSIFFKERLPKFIDLKLLAAWCVGP